jgi:hypothetical protein
MVKRKGEQTMIDKQTQIEREEIAEIIAQNHNLNGEKWDASDYEWAAHCVQMAGYRKASDVAREILREVDNALHDMAMEYLAAGHRNYFAVCEVVHHKVVRPIEKKYESEGEG